MYGENAQETEVQHGVQHGILHFDQACNASHLLAAFREPFSDAAKLTDEVRAIMTDQGPDGEKTTREWEEFMVDAKLRGGSLRRSAAAAKPGSFVKAPTRTRRLRT